MPFESGVLQPLYGLTEDETLALTGHNINAIHRWDVNNNAYWLPFASKVDVIRSPIADDAYSRIYWSGDTRLGSFHSFILILQQSIQEVVNTR